MPITSPVRAVQYLRMSTEHQRYSLANQAAVMEEYAAERGYDIIRSYADAGKSGLKLAGRPALQQLLSDALSGDRDFAAILVLDVSRWGRFQDTDEPAHYEFMCRQAGVQIAYCGEQFENDGGMISNVIKQLKRAMAGEYSRELSAKILAAQKQQARLGFKQGAPVLYGLRRELLSADGESRRTLKPGERKALNSDRVRYVLGPAEEIRVVRRIFEWFVRERLSFTGIAARLNERRVPTNATSGRWEPGVVARMIRSELYRGRYVFNRTSQHLRGRRRKLPQRDWIRAEVVKPIIGPRTFATAQLLAARGHFNRYSDKQLLDALKGLLAREGYLTHRVVRDAPGVPHWGTYRARFGSLQAAFKRIGYERPRGRLRPHGRAWSDEEMLADLRRLRLKHGYLSSDIIRADERSPSVGAYAKRFGSLLQSYAAAGFPVTYAQTIKSGIKRRKMKARVAEGVS